ncbi:TPA: hypothetical protein P8734_005688 [Pseudomonas aeruginosa]|nr:hypothetical protein [Pseudomonas aeruginosa]
MDMPKVTTNSAAEKAHQKALALIYRHTHRDFKGRRDGVKEIMLARGLVALDDLTESDVAELLPQALKKEARRLSAQASGGAV